ncbi:MAG: NACHT domain-containing NTPase [Hydrococcus sp. Prado102]|jgi:predicted NACHT family NTPase|nr:NACHT domain-containing NTPase [Hydrococcus sp. Prado102]
MAKPSLKASEPGLQFAQAAFTKQGLTQETLAAQLGCSRATIIKFFHGHSVWQKNFISISEALGLDWQKIAAFPQNTDWELAESSHKDYVDIALLVQEVRSKVKASIQEWCGTMRILDMTRPIELSQIYTDVNILEKITANRRKTINELCQEFNLGDLENVERFGLGRVTEERVLGLEAVEKYKKLIVLGKPGAGKTTFLKYLAIQCNQGKFKPNLIPIFIPLKYFAEALDRPTLLEYIARQFSTCGVTEEQIQELLKQNSALILLDGLDEVREEDWERTIKEIRDISRQFYDNYFIITCRIAAKEYIFDKFNEVEVADFDDQQIEIFIKNWFRNKSVKAENFLKYLKVNNRCYQLAVTPLLLTLFCLVFEDAGYLPANRSELYQEALDVLLKKWDAKKGIQRDLVYKQLSLQRKNDLLSQIALITFEKKKYLFTQKEAEQYIADYIKNLPDAESDWETLQLDSEAVLRSIEAQHGLLIERAKGIYSFSHLTLHEYFAAREIVIRKRPQKEVLEQLVKHATEKRWREVFLLATEMSQPDASMLLTTMKQYIDGMLAKNKKLQKFLSYVTEVSTSGQLPVKPAAIRAFYFDIDFDIDRERRLSLLLDSSANYLVGGSFFARVFKNTEFEEGVRIAESYDNNKAQSSRKIREASSANEAMYIAVKYALESERLEPKLRNILEKIYQEDSKQIENDGLDEEKVKLLADESRSVAKENRHIGSESWQFSSEEKQLLKQYYDANKLLVECLNTNCVVNHKIRTQILGTLLLPVAEI